MLQVTLGVVLGVAIWVLSGVVITALGWAQ